MAERSAFIDVLLKDGTVCQMVPKALDLMIRNGRVEKFRRSDGWLNVRDIRRRAKKRAYDYAGPERRGSGPRHS